MLLQTIRQSFFLKMLLAFTLFTLLVSTFFTLFFIHHQYRLLTRMQMENGRVLAEIIARNVTLGVMSESTELLSDAVWSAFEKEDVVQVFVYNQEARLLMGSNRNALYPEDSPAAPSREEIRKIIADFAGFPVPHDPEQDYPFLHQGRRDADEFWCGVIYAPRFRTEEAMVLGMDMRQGPTQQMAGVIGLVMDRQPLKQNIIDIARRAGLFGLLFWLIGCFVMFLFVRRFTRPLNRLIKGVRALGLGLDSEKIHPETDDEIGALALSFNDMATSLRSREEALQNSEHKYRSIFENAADGIFQADIDGDLITANPAMARIFDHESAEIMCQGRVNIFSLLNMTHEQNAELMNHPGADFSRAIEIGCQNRSGQDLFLLVHLHTIEEGRNGKRIFEGLIRDFTDQKRSERLKIAKEAAEASADAKSRFLANMSHEIRTPLGAISGMVMLMGQTELTPKQADYLEKIESSSRLLLRVINDVLDISKIEAGKLDLEKIPFSWSLLMTNIEDMFAEKAREKKIELSMGWDREIPEDLNGDAERIKQILINLIGNALKFTPESGFVKVDAHLLKEDSEEIRIGFEISDSGIGIPAEKIGAIFDAFTQADDSMTRCYGGTGLGLSICRQLVELMDGNIQAMSEPGRGTTFCFSLLLEKGLRKKIAAPPQKGHYPSFAGARILIAEDHEVNQEVALSLLEPLKMTVDIAVDGKEAWHAVQRQCYDLILMDLQMPEMDGLEVTRKIRGLPGKVARIPIIAMTAHALSESRRACLDAGMNDFLTKPLDPSLLMETLSRWIKTPYNNSAPAQEKMQIPLGSHEEKGPLPFSEPADPDLGTGTRTASDGTVIDYKEGAIRMGGKLEVFKKILFLFHTHYHQAGEKLAQDLSNGRRENVLQQIHTFKGTAGNCAARRLVKAAEQLEKTIRDGRDHNGDLDQFTEELDRVMAEIDRLRTDSEKVNGDNAEECPPLEKMDLPSPSPETLSPKMKQVLYSELCALEKLLQKNNIRAIPEMERLRDRISQTASTETVKTLVSNIESLDFTRAGKILQQILSGLK